MKKLDAEKIIYNGKTRDEHINEEVSWVMANSDFRGFSWTIEEDIKYCKEKVIISVDKKIKELMKTPIGLYIK